jgi:hypothetical protein
MGSIAKSNAGRPAYKETMGMNYGAACVGRHDHFRQSFYRVPKTQFPNKARCHEPY